MRILALSDQIHPFIHQTRFPGNLPPFDLVLIAGDLPGSYIEFVATKVTVPVLFVHGNHNEEYVQDYLGNLTPPGGAIALHDKVVKVGSLWLAGWGGSPRYNTRAAGQYQENQAQLSFARWYPRLALRRFRGGHGVDILLSHAPPPGPHAGPDYAHRGSTALGYFHRVYRPRLHIHGHVHLYEAQPQREYTTPEGVRVVNAFEYTLVEL
jgi:Icc-related predicted phosphoesterase